MSTSPECRLRTASLAAVLGLIALAEPTAAETITGTLRYAVGDDMRAIAGSEIEVWRKEPGRLGFVRWRVVERVRTDENGSFSVDIPFSTSGVTYSVVVFASNEYASVWPGDHVQGGPFHAEPGFPGAPLRPTVSEPNDVVVFDHDFHDEWTAQHFALADTLRLAGLHAMSWRDRTARPIPHASVLIATGRWQGDLNPVPLPGMLVVDSSIVGQHALIAREYAHFLQASLGSLKWLPSISDGCSTTDLRGRVIDAPELSWTLGFASYFAAAVAAENPHMLLDATLPPDATSACAAAAPSAPGEHQVAAALWDLTRSTERSTGTSADHLLLSIIENGHQETWLTMDLFREAWVLRGGDDATLDAILVARGFRQPSDVSGPLAAHDHEFMVD